MSKPRYENEEEMRGVLGAAKFWGPEGMERFSSEDPDEAIELIIDDLHPGPITDDRITVIGVSPMSVKGALDQGQILEALLEQLDENYGDWDGDMTEPCDAMKAAAKVFAEAIENLYEPFQCRETARFTFSPLAWVKEHRPDWLEDEGGSND